MLHLLRIFYLRATFFPDLLKNTLIPPPNLTCIAIGREKHEKHSSHTSTIFNLIKRTTLIRVVARWRPHEDSNLDLRLRRPPFYPVELWGHQTQHPGWTSYVKKYFFSSTLIKAFDSLIRIF